VSRRVVSREIVTGKSVREMTLGAIGQQESYKLPGRQRSAGSVKLDLICGHDEVCVALDARGWETFFFSFSGSRAGSGPGSTVKRGKSRRGWWVEIENQTYFYSRPETRWRQNAVPQETRVVQTVDAGLDRTWKVIVPECISGIHRR
jgi:hypothetical protein